MLSASRISASVASWLWLNRALAARMANKLGFADPHENQRPLTESVLKLLAQEQVDFTIFWRRLSHAVASISHASSGQAFEPVRDLFIQHAAFDTWLPSYLSRLEKQDLPETATQMRNINPKFVLRNHLGEAAIKQAKMGDFSGVQTLLTLLSSPFDEHPGFDEFAAFPPDWASSIEISCSS